MDQIEAFRRQEARRFLKWIEENRGDWGRMRDKDGLMDAKECVRLMDAAQQRGFYFLFPLILWNNQAGQAAGNTLERLSAENMVKETDESSLFDMMKKVKAMLLEESKTPQAAG